MIVSNSIYAPPFSKHTSLLLHEHEKFQLKTHNQQDQELEFELPLIDLESLTCKDHIKRRDCVEAIAKASSEWGFFQVLNHGISPQLLAEMRREQIALFEMPFDAKLSSGLLDGAYRRGTPTATSLKQLSWSEAFHVPLAKILDQGSNSPRCAMEKIASAMSELSWILAGILAENLGYRGQCFPQECNKNTCFLCLNRYPPCPFSSETFGLTPHTDSDFLTILYQDQVGGLQLMKDSKWVAVKPNADALVVNIGDLFQAGSNDIYKSVEHRVMANGKMDRHSIAYFMCPSYGTNIGSCSEPSLYKNFTFGEFREQVQEDVRRTGQKVGLSRFLL